MQILEILLALLAVSVARLEAAAVWNFAEFVLTALVFILIGLQLRGILERLTEYDPRQLAGLAVAISAVLVLSRFVWLVPATWLLPP